MIARLGVEDDEDDVAPVSGRNRAVVIAFVIIFSAPAGARSRRMGKADDVPYRDPQGARWSFVWDGYRQVYEGLLMTKADLTLVPGLAISWKLVDPITWRFTLRQGVTFHDGTPLPPRTWCSASSAPRTGLRLQDPRPGGHDRCGPGARRRYHRGHHDPAGSRCRSRSGWSTSSRKPGPNDTG